MSGEESLEKRLVASARQAASRAYCPYSRFPVGAAVSWSDGTVTSGCNVENAAWSPSVCAERNAIHHGVALGHRELARVVVFTPTPRPTTPCGVCLQVIREFGPDVHITCVCDGTERIEGRLPDFLPHSFGPHNLPSQP